MASKFIRLALKDCFKYVYYIKYIIEVRIWGATSFKSDVFGEMLRLSGVSLHEMPRIILQCIVYTFNALCIRTSNHCDAVRVGCIWIDDIHLRCVHFIVIRYQSYGMYY